MPLHRLLLLLLLPLVSGQECSHYSQEDLLSRLELNVPKCLGPSISHSVLPILAERFAANDFDRHQPLALMFFSKSSDLMHSLVGAVASSLFGASRSPYTVQIVDFQKLLKPSRASNYDIKQTLRTALAKPLRACPDRNLFVLDNVQALDDAALPVLDVFLDPLNGKRAQFQHHIEGTASRVFDCTNSVFLFLFNVAASHSLLGEDENRSISFNHWREYLMQQWTRPKGAIEEFTPQAFVGRLTDAVAVYPSNQDDRIDAAHDQLKQSREWRRVCELQSYVAGDETMETDGSTRDSTTTALALIAKNVAAVAPTIPEAIAMISIPALLLILTRAKRWNGETMKLKERGAIHRRSSGSSNTRRKKKKTRK